MISNLYQLEGYTEASTKPLPRPARKHVKRMKLQQKIWLLMDSPDSGLVARVIGCWSIIIIIISIVTFCLETLPQFHEDLHVHVPGNNSQIGVATTVYNTTTTTTTTTTNEEIRNHRVIEAMNVVEVFSIIWFCLEYILRLASSPHKWIFFKSFLNLIDLIAILPFFVVILVKHQTGSSLAVVRVARLARILRIFKLSRHSMGLQILGSTLKASMNELGMMLCVICFSVILFSSAIYYAEHNSNASMFVSIPSAFW